MRGSGGPSSRLGLAGGGTRGRVAGGAGVCDRNASSSTDASYLRRRARPAPSASTCVATPATATATAGAARWRAHAMPVRAPAPLRTSGEGGVASTVVGDQPPHARDRRRCPQAVNGSHAHPRTRSSISVPERRPRNAIRMHRSNLCPNPGRTWLTWGPNRSTSIEIGPTVPNWGQLRRTSVKFGPEMGGRFRRIQGRTRPTSARDRQNLARIRPDSSRFGPNRPTRA